MLRKHNNGRTFKDNIKLGALTAVTSGMVNIASLLLFFAFSSNITGHYATVAAEMVKGNFYQVAVVFAWIAVFFLGSFTSGLSVTHLNNKNTYLAHSLPLLIEILCLVVVGVYGQFFYQETLKETEILLSLMLFAMGLQNGFTASISNFSIKTTHLTGTTTDLGILFAMFTKKEFRENKELKAKAKLLSTITVSYVIGSLIAGFSYIYMEFQLFYIVSAFLLIVIIHDYYNFKLIQYLKLKRKKSQYARSKRLVVDNTTLGQMRQGNAPTYERKDYSRAGV